MICRADLDGHRGQGRRVGAHVGDVPVLVEALGHLHRPPRGEAVLAVGFLLQRAGGERRIGPRGVGLVFQFGHAGTASLRSLAANSPACCSSSSRQAGSFNSPVAGSKSRLAGIRRPSTETSTASNVSPPGLGEAWPPGPNRWPREGHPLPLALDDQPHRHALHPSGREPRPDLPPQQAAKRRSHTAGRRSAAPPGREPGPGRSTAGASARRGSPLP